MKRDVLTKKALSKLQEIEGKTIKRVLFGFDGSMLFVFTDGMFSYLKSSIDEDQVFSEFKEDANLEDFPLIDLEELGIATLKDFEDFGEECHRKYKENRYQEYLALKKEFGE